MAMPSFNTSFAARPSMNNHGRLIKFAGLPGMSKSTVCRQ
ncbi:hypothetical protein BIFCAT_00669 [Bifidobacterium catenulatum DSM 16992 = JCM 1194 = LMG 11043]|uniref:Uncharacterized protein n=1 Tax=Bifidobacterium catenulatum DSM 16992 = JCM 1194 = LMG 11043 TaxID=566552 RepID=B6XUS6_9BIFI|nr:hypothetical protein BIFCAT_00669 [Bifidobacterium catenulatum DSM 16992 = JCM 1194 = LMG 11043]